MMLLLYTIQSEHIPHTVVMGTVRQRKAVRIPVSSYGEHSCSQWAVTTLSLDLGGSMSQVSTQWESFVDWLLKDEETKERLNLPRNKTEYAASIDISDRTLRRWQNDPMFKALLEKKTASKVKKGISAVSVDGTPAILEEDDEEMETPEGEYQQIKSALVKGALTGDPKYLDLYFKTYGKDFVAEEAAARTSNLSSLSLDDLIVETATVVGESQLVDYLRSKGYEVVAKLSDEIRIDSTEQTDRPSEESGD